MDTKPATSQLIPHPTTFLQLDRLKFGHEHPQGPVNIRRPDRGSAQALVALIRSKGLLQALLVVPDPDHGGEGPYYTADGGRRLMALHMLRDAGELTPDAPISCIVLTTFEQAEALGASLVVEDTHLPPHPVDRYEAFAAIAAKGIWPEEIAQRHFIAPRVVRQALALGALAPEIRAAWRAGEISAEIAQLFTLADDAKHQVKVLAKLNKKFGKTLLEIRADTVRKEFTGSEAEARRWLAFVGRDAYLEAGGRLTVDLFAGTEAEPALIVHDVSKLKKLAEAKLEIEARRLTEGEGWSWADTDLKSSSYRHGFGRELSVNTSYTKEQKAALATIDKRLKEIERTPEGDDDMELIDEQERLAEDRERIEGAARLASFAPDQKARAGCFVSIGSAGQLTIEAGYTKREDGDTTASAAPEPRGKQSGFQREEPALSDEVHDHLNNVKDAAIGDGIIKSDARVALAACIASVMYEGPLLIEFGGYSGTVELKVKGDCWSRAFAELMKLDLSDLLQLLRSAVSQVVNYSNSGSEDPDDTGALLAAVDQRSYDKHLHEAFDAKAYFKGASVKHMLALIEEDLGEDERRRNADKSQKQLAAFCLDSVATKSWLPPELRGPNYQPSKRAPAPDKAAKAKVTVTAKKSKPAKKAKRK